MAEQYRTWLIEDVMRAMGDVKHPQTIRKLIRQRRNPLPAVKVGGKWQFDPDAVRNWIASGGRLHDPPAHVGEKPPRPAAVMAGVKRRQPKRLRAQQEG
jgi:hypothetical protein